MLIKLIACEIAVREFCYVTARSKNIVDPEFLTQGYHDTPNSGRQEVQKRIEAVPNGKYDAIVLGYGLCSTILAGLRTPHTKMVLPRAHDCITFFLGSKERYQQCFDANPGTYYYTCGWLECTRRRASQGQEGPGVLFPAQGGISAAYEQWVKKYGEEKAQYLLEVMGEWTAGYTHGTLIDYEFTKSLALRDQVSRICGERGWQFSELEGDLGLFQRMVDGDWRENEVLVLEPGQQVVQTFDGGIIAAAGAAPPASAGSVCLPPSNSA